MSSVLFVLTLVWSGTLIVVLVVEGLRDPGAVRVRPVPWLILATLIALTFLARHLGY